MTQKLTDFLTNAKNKDFAVQSGTQMHARLQHTIVDGEHTTGDTDTIKIIQSRPDLLPFFTANAQTEVPIAGNIHGHFISRRIDRLIINHKTKTIDFIDYKTDANKNTFVDKYKFQLNEYAQLLRSACPGYKINGYILWLHDWTLDKII